MNPFEPIGTVDSEEVYKAVEGYKCPICEQIFRKDQYTSVDVYYGAELIDCNCCNSYSKYPGSREDAWFCDNDCFNHDKGSYPGETDQVETGWLCQDNLLHPTEEAANNCY